MSSIEQQAVQAHLVFRSSDFTAVAGVARGEEIGVSDDLVLDDVYQLASGAQRVLLTFRLVGDNRPYQTMTTSRAVGAAIFSSIPASP
jgi:hypothetical protein